MALYIVFLYIFMDKIVDHPWENSFIGQCERPFWKTALKFTFPF